MTRARLAILFLLAATFVAGAATNSPTVAFHLQSWTGRSVNYPITLTPYAPLAVNGTNLVTSASWKLTPSNGVAYASNLLAGDYTLTIENTSAKAVLTVPATNALLDAASLVSVSPAAAAGLAYSKPASDARYVLKGEISGSWWATDDNGDLMPALTMSGTDSAWELDADGNLQPQ